MTTFIDRPFQMSETERQEEVKRLMSPSKQQPVTKKCTVSKTSPAKKQLNLFEIKSTLLDDAAISDSQASDAETLPAANPLYTADTEPEEEEPAFNNTSDSAALDFHLEMSQSMNQSTISSKRVEPDTEWPLSRLVTSDIVSDKRKSSIFVPETMVENEDEDEEEEEKKAADTNGVDCAKEPEPAATTADTVVMATAVVETPTTVPVAGEATQIIQETAPEATKSVEENQEVKEPETVQVKDAQVKDAEVKDAEVKDAEVKDAEVKDAEVKDAEVKDAQVKDAEVKDADAKVAEVKDTDVKVDEVKDAEVKVTEPPVADEAVVMSEEGDFVIVTTKSKLDKAAVSEPSKSQEPSPVVNNRSRGGRRSKSPLVTETQALKTSPSEEVIVESTIMDTSITESSTNSSGAKAQENKPSTQESCLIIADSQPKEADEESKLVIADADQKEEAAPTARRSYGRRPGKKETPAPVVEEAAVAKETDERPSRRSTRGSQAPPAPALKAAKTTAASRKT